MLQAAHDDYDTPVVVASVPTLLRRHNRIERLARGLSLVVVDEAHHAVSKSWMRVLAGLGVTPSNAVPGAPALAPATAGPKPLLVGFTATPDRADGKGLDAVFQEIVYERTMWDMIMEGYLADIRAIQVKMEVDLESCPTKGRGDFDDAALGAMTLVGAAARRVAKAWVEFAESRLGSSSPPPSRSPSTARRRCGPSVSGPMSSPPRCPSAPGAPCCDVSPTDGSRRARGAPRSWL